MRAVTRVFCLMSGRRRAIRAIAVARAMAMRMASQLRAVLVPRMPLLLVKSWGSCACRMRPQMRVAMSMRAMLAVVTMARR